MFTPRDAKRMREEEEEEEGAVSNLISPESKYLDGGKRRSTMVDIFPTFFFPQIAAALLRARFSPTVAAINRVYRAIFPMIINNYGQQHLRRQKSLRDAVKIFKSFIGFQIFIQLLRLENIAPFTPTVFLFYVLSRISAIRLARRKNTLTKNTRGEIKKKVLQVFTFNDSVQRVSRSF